MLRRIHYTGMLRSPASWAKVARELLLALLEAGYPVGASEIIEDRYNLDFPLPVRLKNVLHKPEPGCITLTFSSPSNYSEALAPPPRVGMLVYEATRWPPHWINLAEKYLEHVVVPSTFCLESLLASGYPSHCASVVPHGIDPTLYRPSNRRTPGSLPRMRFLFVGTPVHRKGLDILLSAFRMAFSPHDDSVSLVIKTLTYPDAETRPYVDHHWQENIQALVREGFRIDVLSEYLSDSEMAELYRSADMICLPSRGEGFALPLLEAMACGTPVLATKWSGQTDFCDDSVGILVKEYSLIPGDLMLLDFDHHSRVLAMMVEPSAAEVTRALLCAARERRNLALWSENATQRAQQWTWAFAARQLVNSLAQAGVA